MIASAIGESSKVNRFRKAADKRNPPAAPIRAIMATVLGTSRCRDAVRGFRWSRDQSARRLKNMAADRAQTIQERTRKNTRADGKPPAATINAPRAKGSAKTVCENRIR